jgi:hypothetical protein
VTRQAADGARAGGGIESSTTPLPDAPVPSAVAEPAARPAAPVDRALAEPGEPLDPALGDRFGEALGVDLSGVEVHRGGAADEAATALDALAFTVGSHVVLAATAPDPATPEGERLLAHEVAHVVQQGGAPGEGAAEVSPAPPAPATTPAGHVVVTRPTDAVEAEADRVADRITGGATAAVTPASAGAVARQSPPATAPATEPRPAIGNLPRITANLIHLVFTYPDTTTRFAAGPKPRQGMYLVAVALTSGQGDEATLAKIVAHMAGPLGAQAMGSLAGTSAGDEIVGDVKVDGAVALPLLSWLKAEGITPPVTDDQQEVLRLGTYARQLLTRFHDEPDFREAVLPGHRFPAWYTIDVGITDLHRYGRLLRAAVAAYEAHLAQPADTARRDDFHVAAAALFSAVFEPITVMEAVRKDVALVTEPAYVLIWPPPGFERWAAATTARDPDAGPMPTWTTAAPATADVDARYGPSFLAFLSTQRERWSGATKPGGTDERKKLLTTFFAWVPQARTTRPGDIQLTDDPATSNLPPHPASLSVHPPLGAFFDASLDGTYRYAMQLAFPDVFEAFTRYDFTWGIKKLPDEQVATLAKSAYKTPSTGAVTRQELKRWAARSATDLERAVGGLMANVGQAGAELELVAVNSLFRLLGAITWDVLRDLTRPRSERDIVFTEGAGLYVVACTASQQIQGKGFVRAPATAYMPAVVKTTEALAESTLDLVVSMREADRRRLDELRKELDKKPPPPDYEQKREEAERLYKVLESYGGALEQQLDDLRKRRKALEGQAGTEADRSLLDKQIKRLEETLDTRGARAAALTGATPMSAVFTSDEGSVVALALEVAKVGDTHDDAGRKTGETWYVSDLTTPTSDDAKRTAPTANEAIEAALVAILEDIHGYGYGVVAVQFPGGARKTIKIAKSKGALVMETMEHVATALAVAAVAAAPFTGGASLVLMLPAGIIGAVPSAYRIASRAESGSLRFDLALAMDVVNVVGAFAGLGEVTTPLRMIRLSQAFLIIGAGANGLGVLLMGAQIAEQIEALKDSGYPPGLRLAKTMEIVGNALLQAGIMVGATLAQRAKSRAREQTIAHSAGTKEGTLAHQSFESWLNSLKEGADQIRADPAVYEAFRTMDPEVRRAITLCASLCIPVPPPKPAVLAKIHDFMRRLNLPPDHPGLREFLYDQRNRSDPTLTNSADALAAVKNMAEAQKLFDTAIASWAVAKGLTATKVNGRWRATRPDGTVVREWTVDTHGNLTGNLSTDGFYESHHGIQDAWAQDRGIPGYGRDDCPAILLRDKYAGSPHQRITARQSGRRADRGKRSYVEERQLMLEDMKRAEVPDTVASDLLARSDAYFEGLYRAWEADLRSKNVPQGTIDATLNGVFGKAPPW